MTRPNPTPRRRTSAEAISAAPLVGVTDDVTQYLREAIVEGDPGERSTDDPYLEARRAAAEATERSKESPSDPALVKALSRANARVAATASVGLERFPDEVEVRSLISVANLSVSLGRSRQLDGDLESALERFMAGLALVESFKSYTRVAEVDAPLFNIAARAASIVGELAARRELSLEEMLEVLHRNITSRYEPLMSDHDLSGPRGFAAVAFLREALLSKKQGYVRRVRDDVVSKRRLLRPETMSARIRFDADLNALLRTAEIALGEERPSEFRW